MASVPQHLFKLHRGQFEIFKHKARFRVLACGRRWGKTALSRAEIIRAAISKSNMVVWYVAPTYQMAKDLMWRELIEVIPPSLVKKTNQTEMTMQLINGSLIACKSADNPNKLRGMALDFVVLDEFQEMKSDVWDAVLRPTLATTGGRAVFLGTPKMKNHLFDMFKKGQDPENVRSGEFKSWQYTTADSPFVTPKEIASAKRELDEKTFRQEFEASFESMQGRVYYPFERKIHVGNYGFDPTYPIWVGQDFNVDPMASAVMQYHPEKDELWIIDEIIIPNSNTEEAIRELERKYGSYKRFTTIYPDASGANRTTAGQSDIQIIKDIGYKRIKHPPKNPNVSDRINAVNRMLMSADGTVRMRVNKKCLKTIEAFEQVIYKPGTRVVDKSMNIEHITDAVGYCVNKEFPVRKVTIFGYNL